MKSVLISIQPKWCELIASGKKTVEVRKTRPKLETPFKVYIYCTKNKRQWLRKVGTSVREVFITEPIDVLGRTDNVKAVIGNEGTFWERGGYNGKVIGEFICDWIESTPLWRIRGETGFCAKRTKREEALPKMSCLSIEDLEKYAGSKNGLVCGWHISNLVIYDEPKELSEFKTPPCERPEKACENCKYLEVINTPNYYEVECYRENGVYLTRPPQSWCYVDGAGWAE